MSVSNKSCSSSIPVFITVDGRRKWYEIDEGNEMSE
jgi:hypothetical protein